MTAAPFRPLTFGVTRASLRDGAAGTRYLMADQPLAPYPERMSDRLKHWAQAAPERSFVSRALLSPSVSAGVLAALVALVRHLYLARGAWGDGAVAYMPRITDSWDVAACVGVVACLAYLLGCGGMMFVAPIAGGGRASPPQSRAASPTGAAARQRAGAAS